MGLVGTAWGNDSDILPFPFTQTHHKQPPPQKKAYRMRGQIYSQSGSWVIWLDAFLEWSFLSILLSFSEVSPQLPPLPQHSSLLFILYKYNQTEKQPTLAYPRCLCWFVLHTYTCMKTHINGPHARTHKGGCWQSATAKRPSPCLRFKRAHFDTL